jgi:membrane protein required for colicin V production
MNEVDYAILAVVAASAVLGALRGFLREALGLATWVVAIWAAASHSDLVSPYLGGALADEPLRTWAARGIVLLAILAIGTFLSTVIGELVSVSLFRGLDRLLGVAFGALRAIIVIGLVVLLGRQFELTGESWWRASRLMPYGERAADVVQVLAGEVSERVRDAAAPGPGG